MNTTNYFIVFLVSIPGLILAPALHEFTKAVISMALGDDLPKRQKMLTLNPFKYFEPIGFLLLFYSGGFGWGKPVETSGLYYKNRKRDTLMVAILPSVVNFVCGAIFLGLSGQLATRLNPYIILIFKYMCVYNIGIALYNILPVAPMDCVKVLSTVLPANKYFRFMQNEKMIQMFFLLFMFFGFVTGIMNVFINGAIDFLSIIMIR